jgi:hypothetical protein
MASFDPEEGLRRICLPTHAYGSPEAQGRCGSGRFNFRLPFVEVAVCPA